MFTEKMNFEEFKKEFDADAQLIFKNFCTCYLRKNMYKCNQKRSKTDIDDKIGQVLDMYKYQSKVTKNSYYVFVVVSFKDCLYLPQIYGVLERSNGKRCLLSIPTDQALEKDPKKMIDIFDYHIFTRYGERALKKDLPFDKIVYKFFKKFIESNLFYGQNLPLFNKKIEYSAVMRLKDGALLGELSEDCDKVHYKTFISLDMLHEEQAKVIQEQKEVRDKLLKELKY